MASTTEKLRAERALRQAGLLAGGDYTRVRRNATRHSAQYVRASII